MQGEQRQFDTVLVANRGEIACRILRTVRAMGLGSVAVYSEADAGAPHVAMADRAVCIGPPPAGESYLRIDRVLAAASSTGADAVHPGYGFLSENAGFATACAEAGVVFIGPDPRAIEIMGNKAAAKRLMLASGVPCIPGYEGEDQSDQALMAAGGAIGYPLMVKAAAGGGGRGMRFVSHADELASAIGLARSEAESAFGSGELILEKAINRARHVEIQVIADRAGRTLHLGERDCSIQRRHQKVIEEAPSPALTPALRREMGAAAVRVAEAIDYVGAGTVEFLLDAHGDFYFLEMNTRLQVEHPVTELVTGLDLVEQQIRIARGESLELSQDAVRLQGHAIEARLYTEDPARDFMPATGTVALWRPAADPDVRIDDGIWDGQAITPFYDALAAKIVAWGTTRDVARRRLIAGLQDTALFGLPTNKTFLIGCLTHDRFAGGDATTAFVDEVGISALQAGPAVAAHAPVTAAVLFLHVDRETALANGPGVSRTLLDWSSGIDLAAHYEISSTDATFSVTLTSLASDRYRASVGNDDVEIAVESIDASSARMLIDGQRIPVRFNAEQTDQLWFSVAGCDYSFTRAVGRAPGGDERSESGRVTAAMHGVVLELAVETGVRVEKGQRLLVMEAMKMQQEIVSPVTGSVTDTHVRVGQQVASGDPLVTIDEEE